MSCLDVMYHQSYGAHYLPAAAYKATCYNHHQQQQQRRLSVYSKMDQAALGAAPGRRSTPDLEQKDSAQPTETEYLGSRCVLFTYFQGEIGDVVDEHFSRALNQSGTFGGDTKQIRVSQPSASNGSWKGEFNCGSEGQSTPIWSGAYPAQSSSCLSSLHPDFAPSPVSLNHPDGSLWADHLLAQGGLPPPSNLPDSWAYSLNSQSSSSYPAMLHSYQTH
uniref:Vestigial like family member 3 n=1 Tax=Tetraodon nigroviridis TaxID=99883 RepID=H3DG78_TETNG